MVGNHKKNCENIQCNGGKFILKKTGIFLKNMALTLTTKKITRKFTKMAKNQEKHIFDEF